MRRCVFFNLQVLGKQCYASIGDGICLANFNATGDREATGDSLHAADAEDKEIDVAAFQRHGHYCSGVVTPSLRS